MKNVLEWLEAAAARLPNKPVYLTADSSITFGEVLQNSRKIGTALAEVPGKAPIAIISSRSAATICGYLGIVYSGHAYAPIDGSLPRKRIDTILERLCPAAIVADAAHIDLAHQLSDNCYQLETMLETQADSETLARIRRSMVMTDPLYVIFTSGSTGKPKGVITAHQSLICYIESYVGVMGLEESDVLGNQSPLDYIAAIRDIYIPLMTGCSTVLIPKEYFMQPDRLFQYMNDKAITAVGWSVSAFTIPVSLGAFQDVELTTLRKICFSGSVMPAPVLHLWQQHLPQAKFVNQYGPTEATASCTYYVVDHTVESQEQLPIGVPYNNYRVFLLNADLTETPAGEIGEICVSGPILALGYYNDPERTAKSFVINPNCTGYPERMYRTGDYGRLRPDGLLEFHGRMDRQIKHMGHRVELDEIEVAANQVPGVKECAALYNPAKEALYLFYAGTAEKRTLALELRQKLPDFMVPRKIKLLETLPKLANGKTDINTLKESM